MVNKQSYEMYYVFTGLGQQAYDALAIFYVKEREALAPLIIQD